MPALKALPVLLSVLFICSVPFFLPRAAAADCPSCTTHEFHGTVSNNGKVVGAGYVVTAVVNGQEMAAATTDMQGKWGASQPFTVTSPAGSLIDFYVNGVLVGSGASCIPTNELNLAASGAPPTPDSTTSVASGTEGSQPSLSPAPPGTQSSSCTLTFFNGPQPSTSPATAVIKCSLPGQQGNLILNNGVLSSPRELASAGGAIELDLAANTTTNLIASQQLSIEPAASAPAAPAGSEIVAAYSFEPGNSTFTPPLTLKLKYDVAKLPADVEETSLYIAQLGQSGDWMALPSTIDRGSNKVSVQISHFSVYGLLGRLTPVSSASIPPAQDPEGVPPPVHAPTAETIQQDGGTSPSPAGAGTATQTSGMDILALGVLITGGIIVILLLLAIIRKRRSFI